MEDDLTFKPSKRVRTSSPESVPRRASAKAKERFRARTEEYMRRIYTERDARREARDRAFMKDIIAEMPEEHIWPNGGLKLTQQRPYIELTNAGTRTRKWAEHTRRGTRSNDRGT
jgi:hypothetical protein